MRELSPAAQVAKLIKAEIKKAYLGIKIRVKSENYSMGDSVNVYMVDQPSEINKAIKEMTAKYQYGSFNGMEDIYEYTNSREDIPQTKYLFINNEISKETKQALKAKIANDFGLTDPTNENEWRDKVGCWSDQAIWRAFCEPEYDNIRGKKDELKEIEENTETQPNAA